MIYDDRKVSAEAMLADADLLVVPIRIIVSPKNAINDETQNLMEKLWDEIHCNVV